MSPTPRPAAPLPATSAALPQPGPTVALAVLERTLRDLGETALVEAPELAGWAAATSRLLDAVGPAAPDDTVGVLATAARWGRVAESLAAQPRSTWGTALRAPEGARRTGPGALALLLAAATSATDLAARVAAREARIARLLRLDPAGLRAGMALDTEAAVAALDALRDDVPTALARRVREASSLLAALGAAAAPHAALEHEGAPEGVRPMPLLDHLATRVLGRKLRGLELADRARFQTGEGLSEDAFAAEVARLHGLAGSPLQTVVRQALLHLDVAKGGTPEDHARWMQLGVDLSVHNTAAARLLACDPQAAWPLPTDRPGDPALAGLVCALVDAHGIAGQIVRGEMPVTAFASFVAYLDDACDVLAPTLAPAHVARASHLSRTQVLDAVLDCLHLVNVCDTAGVREGLMTDALREALAEVEGLVRAAALQPGDAAGPHPDPAARLAAAEHEVCARRGGRAVDRERTRAADRLARLRATRARLGESPSAMSDLLAPLSDDEVGRLARLLDRCRFWYAESGTAALSAESQLKLLLIGMLRAAAATDRKDPGGPFHLSCLPLAATLGDRRQPATAYRVRLVETLLAPYDLSGLLAGALPDDADSPLGSVHAEIGGHEAVRLTYQESVETAALLTLLPIYERKSSAAFHATLKALCDLYGLRKDDFDRVANEELYLAHMNGARGDKQRMLDHVRPGRIAEVGPGGGVVLDLLEEAHPDSEILGVDASAMVVEALQRRRAAEGRRWSVHHADAFRLPEIVGEGALDSVVFCSVLHEIYSYVEYPGDGGAPPARFRLESVRDLLRASYRALRPGGRLVVRDGVMPERAEREIEFLTPDAAEFFDLFAAQFEARAVRYARVGERRVRLDSADAMEFLYTYVWGPESFPYEVREQYGVLPYAEYRDAVLTWLGADGEPAPVAVPLSAEQATYVQGGYRRGLAGRVRLTDADGREVELPPTNALWVFEKPTR